MTAVPPVTAVGVSRAGGEGACAVARSEHSRTATRQDSARNIRASRSENADFRVRISDSFQIRRKYPICSLNSNLNSEILNLKSLLSSVQLSSRVQLVEIQQRIENQEVTALCFPSPDRIVRKRDN